MARITVTIDTDHYRPGYVYPIHYHVTPGRLEVLAEPRGNEIQCLMDMLHQHCATSKQVTISYEENA